MKGLNNNNNRQIALRVEAASSIIDTRNGRKDGKKMPRTDENSIDNNTGRKVIYHLK